MDITVEPLEPAFDETYDVAIVSVGYEQRSSFLAPTLSGDAKIAIVFTDRHVHSFDENLRVIERCGFRTVSGSGAFVEEIAESVRSRSLVTPGRPLRVAFDISSMTRQWIADIVCAMRDTGVRVSADFLYTIAHFTAPPEPPLTQYAGPVTPQLAGWDEPDKPLSLLLGLGYEKDRALGAAELLEPSELYVFSPVSIDIDYERALEAANVDLWGLAPTHTHRFTYQISRPFDTFVQLESLAEGLLRRRRVVLLPLGPKIFALCTVLLAASQSAYGVWRVSAGEHETPVDRKAAGTVVGLRVQFLPEGSAVP
ncbi:MAG TPA: hypothetical protein VGQ46_21295 [Thermoanaerobaculia bacterium]|nr:hypothetical protein [Thermoanaerobaculia bacterium]